MMTVEMTVAMTTVATTLPRPRQQPLNKMVMAMMEMMVIVKITWTGPILGAIHANGITTITTTAFAIPGIHIAMAN
jgi:hypothetical protein